MPLHVSARHNSILQSEIRSMTLACKQVGGINLAQGVCDTPVPQVVQKGAQDAISQGINTYTRYDGRHELREAIAGFYARHYNLAIDPEHEIVVSAGATGALYCACQALFNAGDEIIIFEPYYGYHVNTLVSLDLVPRFVPLKTPTWELDLDLLKKTLGPNTRALIINTPANPCGKIFTHAELTAIYNLATQHDLFVITDEIYEHFVYDGHKHIPPMSLAGARKRTITIGGLSKTFSITGWRIGYCICDTLWAQTIGHFSDLIYVCAPAPLQIGAAAGLDSLNRDYYSEMAQSYQKKRDKLSCALSTAGLTPFVPVGSYYILANISKIPGDSAKERTLAFLHKTLIASVPGNAFFQGDHGENFARFCFAKEDSIIEEACKKIESVRW